MRGIHPTEIKNCARRRRSLAFSWRDNLARDRNPTAFAPSVEEIASEISDVEWTRVVHSTFLLYLLWTVLKIQTTFRSGSTGESIRFAIGQCSLGSVLIAATGQGICAILLGDDPAELMRELHGRFPEAERIGEDRDFEQLVAKVVGLIEAPSLRLDLPLDVRGTPFQQRVWQALQKIPAGQTATYAKIAERIGAPKQAYAVGQACASNVIAVAIPCHRVIRKNGALAGYRWGVERKRTLLEREAARA